MLNLNRKAGFWGLLKQEKWEPNSYDKQRKQGNFDHAGHAAFETLINVSHYNASTNNAPVDLVGGLKLVTPNQGLNRIYRGPRGATKISKIKNSKNDRYNEQVFQQPGQYVGGDETPNGFPSWYGVPMSVSGESLYGTPTSMSPKVKEEMETAEPGSTVVKQETTTLRPFVDTPQGLANFSDLNGQTYQAPVVQPTVPHDETVNHEMREMQQESNPWATSVSPPAIIPPRREVVTQVHKSHSAPVLDNPNTVHAPGTLDMANGAYSTQNSQYIIRSGEDASPALGHIRPGTGIDTSRSISVDSASQDGRFGGYGGSQPGSVGSPLMVAPPNTPVTPTNPGYGLTALDTHYSPVRAGSLDTSPTSPIVNGRRGSNDPGMVVLPPSVAVTSILGRGIVTSPTESLATALGYSEPVNETIRTKKGNRKLKVHLAVPKTPKSFKAEMTGKTREGDSHLPSRSVRREGVLQASLTSIKARLKKK